MSAAAILSHLATPPDWSILGMGSDATGCALLVTYRPTRRHGNVWYRRVGPDRFAMTVVRCTDDERSSDAGRGDA